MRPNHFQGGFFIGARFVIFFGNTLVGAQPCIYAICSNPI